MATPRPADPVKFFVAVLFTPRVDWQALRERLTGEWGAIDFEGSDHAFDVTEYYEPEMGTGLQRRMISFERLVAPESLVDAKLASNEIEKELVVDVVVGGGGRSVNLDVGYFDLHKIVLASGKYDGPKISLGSGIYADVVCRYTEGEFVPSERTFPDFSRRLYDDEFLKIRTEYKRQLREWNRAEN